LAAWIGEIFSSQEAAMAFDQRAAGGHEAPRSSAASTAVGKSTLTERLTPIGAAPPAVQTHAGPGGGPGPERVREAAGRGISGSATSLPHAAAIQRAFGPAHDVSHVQAHVGDAAAGACRDMNASAYATGNHVAFASAPDLHIAAHGAPGSVPPRSMHMRRPRAAR
jgi:hypothetical protein